MSDGLFDDAIGGTRRRRTKESRGTAETWTRRRCPTPRRLAAPRWRLDGDGASEAEDDATLMAVRRPTIVAVLADGGREEAGPMVDGGEAASLLSLFCGLFLRGREPPSFAQKKSQNEKSQKEEEPKGKTPPTVDILE